MRRAARIPALPKKPPGHPVAVSSGRRARLLALLSVLLAVGGVYVATGNWRRRLLEESARSRRVIAAAEQARSARRQRADREKALVMALQSHPDLVDVRLELAQLRWEEAGPQAAAAVLQSDRVSLTDPRLQRLLAGAQRWMGREDRALATLDRAIRLAPGDGDLRAERALLFSLMGWFPEAETALREAEDRHADAVQLALVRATMARQQRDLRAAERELQTARRRSPDDPELIRQLAAVAAAEGHTTTAGQLLEPLAETDPDPETWVALARLQMRTDLARARADLEHALALRPEMPAARRLLGHCLRRSGELSQARSILERLYRERPDQEGVAFELALVYRDLGMADRAKPLMAQYQESQRRRAAMRHAAVVVMNQPRNARAHLEMGRLCLEHGMIGRAILSLERAQTLDPRLPGVRKALAAARRASGSRVEEGEPAGLNE